MKKNVITFRHSILINKPKEFVWDYTQNYDNRIKWDSSIIQTEVLQTTPNRIVKLKMKGNTSMTFTYKLYDRPNKTTLAAKEIQSSIIDSAGGSWTYEEQNDKTFWTQTNSIVFKNNLLLRLSLPLFKWFFNKQTRDAMYNAKKMIEQG